jgi:two-component system response regulator HydG
MAAGRGGVLTRTILVVDNDPEMVGLLRGHLETQGWLVSTATSGPGALVEVTGGDFDVILTDLVMDDTQPRPAHGTPPAVEAGLAAPGTIVDGLTILREAHRRDRTAHVILMTAFGSLESAMAAIRHGAYDFLTKPFTLDEVTLAVQRALDDRRLREENRRLKAQVAERFSFDRILGRSKAMQAVFEQIHAVAASDAAILLLGESGTGKELVAHAIHQHSLRGEAPFVPVNCAAIPEALLESELFGHEKGAFTGADRKRRGLFVEARGGTVFLDEVGDIPPALQVKLLRVLQDKAIRPVGGSQEVVLDLRVISATHRDLPALVGHGKFREDLYYRLAVIPIRLPSLRERTEDIMLLAEHFLGETAATLGKRVDGFDAEATAWLLGHQWPGNVRELRNVVERAATLSRGERVTLADLRIEFAADSPSGSGRRATLAQLEDQYVRRILQETGGDKIAAARILGVSVRTLQRKTRRGPSSPDDMMS